jgi:DNA-directed RNA polymerase subunit RPC12/RpoP
MSVDHDAHFQHEPLDLRQATTIRLIEILPTGADETVACRVRHATTEAHYTCLSYVWGSSRNTKTIHMNGKPFQVRENLWNFLRTASSEEACASTIGLSNNADKATNLILKKAKSSLWIDALCIDQGNNGERNHQVQQMGNIFSSAQRVIAWMGTSPQVTSLFRYVRDELHAQYFFDANYFIELAEFSTDDYWKRAWITQEVQLARQVVLLANNIAIDLALLRDGIELPVRRTFGDIIHRDLWRYIDETLRQRDEVTLLGNMDRFWKKESSDRLDVVYSLLSLSTNGAEILVEYGISTVQLAQKILRLLRNGLCIWAARTVIRTLQLSVNWKDIHPIYDISGADEVFMHIRAQRYDSAAGRCSDCGAKIQFAQRYEKTYDKTYIHCMACDHLKSTVRPTAHLLFTEKLSVQLENKTLRTQQSLPMEDKIEAEWGFFYQYNPAPSKQLDVRFALPVEHASDGSALIPISIDNVRTLVANFIASDNPVDNNQPALEFRARVNHMPKCT